jgi:8-oxo-dGTP pyrophosphatase MutT (NUDIX family)
MNSKSIPYAAVSIITVNHKEVLILKRAINPVDPWSGQLSLPGGRVEAFDNSTLDAAIRETKEECNIDLNRNKLQKELPTEFAGSSALAVKPFHFNLGQKPKIVLETAEHSEFYWVKIDYLLNLEHHEYKKLSTDSPEKIFPSITVGKTPLWGFTYKVLKDFFKW